MRGRRRGSIIRRVLRVMCLGIQLGVLSPGLTGGVAGQVSDSTGGRMVEVFLDCDDDICDAERVVQDIQFVVWVREPQDADVHVLVTSVQTESDAETYELRFLGRGVFDGENAQLTVPTPDWFVMEERTRAWLEVLKVGLSRYAVRSSAAPYLRVDYDVSALGGESGRAAGPAADPWKRWVFQFDVGGAVDSESKSRTYEVEGTFRANRTTEGSKLVSTVYGSRVTDEFEFDDGTLRSSAEYWGASALAVLSAGARWGLGLAGEVYSSTFDNTELLLRGAPAIEFNVFPYAESARRYFTFQYTVGWNEYDFEEVTLYDRLEQVVWDHRFLVDTEVRQTWGSLGLSALASQFLSDASRYRFEVSGSLSYRLVRGLSMNISGRYGVIRDQIGLPREDATDEEVLLRRRRLATEFRAGLQVGLQLRFGSALANVVNTRLDTR